MALRIDVQNLLPDHIRLPLRVRIEPPKTMETLHMNLRNELQSILKSGDTDTNAQLSELVMDVEIYDQKLEQFVPLQTIGQLSRRSRLNIVLHDDGVNAADSCLALPSKLFNVDPATFRIRGERVYVGEVGNTGLGTGLTTWDGSAVLAKYIEHKRSADIRGKRILELGSGTGLVGISAALLGAREVVLTDLPYTMENLARNVAMTKQQAHKDIECKISTEVLDWFHPPIDMGQIDWILASDVVWVEELIPPLVHTFDVLLQHSDVKTQILMSHQIRSKSSDELLFRELEVHKLKKTLIPPNDYHPEFSTDRIHIWEIERV